jgi:hypothetical protein
MAGRPGRDGLIPVRRSIDRGRLILALQAVLLACLALGAIALFSLPPSNADCCLPPQFLGVFPTAEIGLLLLAVGLRWWYGRSGPLALVDGVIVAPLPAFLAGSGTDPGLLWAAAAIGLAAGLGGAILSVLEVRRHPIERIVVAAAFLGLTIAVLSAVVIVAIPALLLALTVWPTLRLPVPGPRPAATVAAPSPGRAVPSAHVRRAGDASMMVVGSSGRLEPDVRAILGPRSGESSLDDAAPAAREAAAREAAAPEAAAPDDPS